MTAAMTSSLLKPVCMGNDPPASEEVAALEYDGVHEELAMVVDDGTNEELASVVCGGVYVEAAD